MNLLRRFLAAIDKINEVMAKTFAWAMFILVLTMTYEVISRYLFDSPTIWSYDVSYFLGSLTLMLGMAYTLKIKDIDGQSDDTAYSFFLGQPGKKLGGFLAAHHLSFQDLGYLGCGNAAFAGDCRIYPGPGGFDNRG